MRRGDPVLIMVPKHEPEEWARGIFVGDTPYRTPGGGRGERLYHVTREGEGCYLTASEFRLLSAVERLAELVEGGR